MIQKISGVFGFLSKEVQGLQRAAIILAGAALLSSILALLRDRYFAHVFGAGATLDVYYAAFRIPDLIFVGTGALVSVYILIPELSRRSDADQKYYLDTILTGFSLFAVLASIVAGLLAPIFLAALFPAFVVSGKLPTVVMLTRIMLLQPIFLGLSNIFAAVTQARGRYALYAISPLLYNLGIIVGAGILYPLFGIAGLAWGVVLGAALHMGIQIPSVMRDGFLNRMPRVHDMRFLSATVFVSLPRSLALSMSQLAFVGLISLAGALTTGSIAVFMFAYNLQAVPLAIIGASYSVAAFPTLAAALSQGKREEFLDHIAAAARYVLFWSLPASALVLTLRAHMVRFILGSGAFDWTDTRLTAAVFALLSLSLAAQGISLLLIRGYYAAGRTFVPLVISAGTAVLTVLLAWLGIHALSYYPLLAQVQSLMRLSGVPGSGVLSLGIAYAVSAIIGAIIMAVHFEYRFGGLFSRIQRTWWEGLIAALAALAGSYLLLELAGPLDTGSTTTTVFLQGLAGGLAGLLATVLTYWVMGSRELSEIGEALHGKLFERSMQASTVVIVAPTEEQVGSVA